MAALLLSAAAARAQTPISIAAGPRNDTYWKLASYLRRKPDLPLEIKETSGSVESLRKLETGQVRFALAQQDVVRDLFLEKGKATPVRVVGRVSFDYLHIFVRHSLHVETSDLGHLRIWLGEPGSGTRLTAEGLLDSLGTPISSMKGNVVPSLVPPGAAPATGLSVAGLLADRLRDGSLDAAMLVTTPGFREACTLTRTAPVTLFSLDPRTLRQLTEEEGTEFRKQTAIGRIPADTYKNQPAPVATIAVPVLLLARAGEGRRAASSLLHAARTAWEDLAAAESANGCKAPDTFPEAASLKQSGLELLDETAIDDPLWPRIGPLAIKTLLFLACLGLAVWGYRRGWHEQVRSLWRQDKLPFTFVLLLGLAIVLVTLTTYSLEHGINEHFSTIRESFWSITVYLFSGLEDRTPYTDEGRVVATLGLLIGPVFFAVMSGWLARFFIHRRKRMPHNLTDHFLLLNWNTRAADVVRELHHPIIREREGTFVVVVLTDDESLEIRRFKEAGSGRDAAFEDFYVSIGDPTDERALRNANASDARSILILSDDAGSDDRTIRSVMMLRKIAREAGRNDLHVVAELSNPANANVLSELARDFPGLLEQISGLEIRTFLMSQAALSAGIVAFYSDLLHISAETNEMYTLDIPTSALGMTFRDYAALVLRCEADEPLVPVGLQRMIDGRSRMLTNPRKGEPGWIIEEGDHLLVLAYLPPLPGVLPEARATERVA